jgi:hypothetical protein
MKNYSSLIDNGVGIPEVERRYKSSGIPLKSSPMASRRKPSFDSLHKRARDRSTTKDRDVDGDERASADSDESNLGRQLREQHENDSRENSRSAGRTHYRTASMDSKGTVKGTSPAPVDARIQNSRKHR